MSEQCEFTVVFDGECNLCESSVLFIIHRDAKQRFCFVAAQSETGRALQARFGLDALAQETFILIHDGEAFTASDAALEVARHLDGPWKALWVLRIVPRLFRDRVYATVARHRYAWFGRKSSCMTPAPDLRNRFLD